MTSLGIEPATFRPVAQCLLHDDSTLSYIPSTWGSRVQVTTFLMKMTSDDTLCWQIHLPAELVLPATSANARSTITIIRLLRERKRYLRTWDYTLDGSGVPIRNRRPTFRKSAVALLRTDMADRPRIHLSVLVAVQVSTVRLIVHWSPPVVNRSSRCSSKSSSTTALRPFFGPWPLFQFPVPVHSR
jgi:hypothetical protein